MTDRPLLLIDVDGPLNPYDTTPSKRPEGYQTYRMRPRGYDHPRQKPLRVWLNHDHGPQLLKLPYDLVWATTWAEEANEWIGPHLGLPKLPVIAWPEEEAAANTPRWRSKPDVFWKTKTVVTYAAGRPFAWIDDDITDLDRQYVAAHHPGRALLHHVHPARGLLSRDFEALAQWARVLASEPPPTSREAFPPHAQEEL